MSYFRHTSAVSSKRQDSLAFPLCRYSFADGRHCAQPASSDSHGLCYTHAHMPHRRLRRSDLIRALGSPKASLADPASLQRFMDKLPRAYAEGLITRRELHVYRFLHQVIQQCSRDCNERDLSQRKKFTQRPRK
jgi:hypothetical protein